MNLSEEITLRISEALDHVDQANAIYNFALFGLSGFKGTGDPKWDHKFAAMVNVANLIDGYPEEDEQTITKASDKIVKNKLPRLLCISLVSAIETCLEDIVALKFQSTDSGTSEYEINKKTRKLTAGGPIQYLPKISNLFGIDFFKDQQWNDFIELVATRNIIIHKGQPIADDRYIKNAGPLKRASVGESIDIDNKYLVKQYIVMKNCLLQLLQKFN